MFLYAVRTPEQWLAQWVHAAVYPLSRSYVCCWRVVFFMFYLNEGIMERIWLVCVFVYINVCTCMQNELTHVGFKKKIKYLYIRWYINVCSLPKLFCSFYALNCAAESRGHSWHVTMKFCFFFLPPNHNEPTKTPLFKNLCTYILSSCFLPVVLSALSQRQLLWSLYDRYPYMCIITLELEYLIQRFAINGALFSPKNKMCS